MWSEGIATTNARKEETSFIPSNLWNRSAKLGNTKIHKNKIKHEYRKLVQEQKYKLAVSSQPAAQNPANSTVTSFQNRMSR